MRFLLFGQGTTEVFWSIAGALVDLGHEVAIAFPKDLVSVLDRPIDVLITMNLLDSQRDTVERLVNGISSLGARPLVINLCLTHPLIELRRANSAGVPELDEWLTQNRIHLWCMCPGTTVECSNLGLTSISYFPLGVHPYVYAVDDGDGSGARVDGRWMSKHRADLVRIRYGDVGDTSDTSVEAQVSDRFVYLGQCVPEVEDTSDTAVRRAAEAVSDTLRKYPNMLRCQALEHCGLSSEMRDDGWLLEFHKSYAHRHSIAIRREFVVSLARAFGDSLAVWGDGWDEFGVTAHPASTVPRGFYDRAAVCLDFGSLAYDTTIFPRTAQIIKCGGLLMSWRHADSGLLFGPFENILTFTDEGDAISRLSGIKADPDFSRQLRQAHLSYASQHLAFTRILGEMFSTPQ